MKIDYVMPQMRVEKCLQQRLGTRHRSVQNNTRGFRNGYLYLILSMYVSSLLDLLTKYDSSKLVVPVQTSKMLLARIALTPN